MNKYLMFFYLSLFILFLLQILPAHSGNITITILYDNYVYTEGTRADWGFSCLIQGTEKTILFDTGTKPDILFHNIKKLQVNIQEVELIVLSHDHGDHTGGLFSLLKENHRVSVYIPHVFSDAFFTGVKKHGADAIAVTQSRKICNNVYLTGQIGDQIPEQSIILDTDKGGVLITGCSHPGIVKIIEKSKRILGKKIHMVFGGFHLMGKSMPEMQKIIRQFKKLGVEKVGPTHCTGDKQLEAFKKAYGKHFIRMGTGKILSFSS